METIIKRIDDSRWVKNPTSREVYINTLLEKSENEYVEIRIVKVMPGGEIIPHTHKNNEYFYLLEGEGSALINGERKRVKKGDLIFAPAGIEHGLLNDTDAEIKLYCIFAPIV